MKSHISDDIQKRVVESIQKREKVKGLRIGHVETDEIPSSGKKLHKMDAFKFDDPNGPRFSCVVDEDGKEVDVKALGRSESKVFFEKKPLGPGSFGPMASPAASITIDPTDNNLVLNPGDNFEEEVTVKIPGDVGVSKVDTYFLADTTGSMSSILTSVKSGANSILTALSGLGIDMAFGVGNYKDFPSDPFAFQHQLNPSTTAADVTNAINAWSSSGGSDIPEGQLFALDQVAEPPGGAIGWRAGAKRIIVWFGDAPGHDPVCAAISGLPYNIDEASATAKLVAQNISVIAISTTTGTTNALDGDPAAGAGDYTAACGPVGGSSGQATRIANATSGKHVIGIDETTIVNTIISLVSSAATTINNVNLVPTGGTEPFVVSISPPGGYGPLSGDKDHVLTFKVQFKGIEPCSDKDKVFNGFLEAIADGVVVARKRVQITVPACKPKEIYSYIVKYVCGVQEACDCSCTTGVRPGSYATEINIYNYNDDNAPIEKRVVPVVFAGAAQGREPKFASIKARDKMVLPPNSATMDDCCRIIEMLLDSAPSAKFPLNIGFLEILSTVELKVTAVYTATDLESHSISIDVEQIEAKLKKV